jgi:hypothetical protein
LTNESRATFLVRFDALDGAPANRAAAELRDLVERAADAGLATRIVKERTDTQDLGATLILVLSTPAVALVARAIYAYVAKRGDRVVITTEAGKVIASGAAAANIDVAQTVEAMCREVDE